MDNFLVWFYGVDLRFWLCLWVGYGVAWFCGFGTCILHLLLCSFLLLLWCQDVSVLVGLCLLCDVCLRCSQFCLFFWIWSWVVMLTTVF